MALLCTAARDEQLAANESFSTIVAFAPLQAHEASNRARIFQNQDAFATAVGFTSVTFPGDCLRILSVICSARSTIPPCNSG